MMTNCKVLSAAAALVVLASFLPAGAAGPRLLADLGEPLVVDGQLYRPGVLSLRSVAEYNPASIFHEVWVGDQCLGLLLAERSPADGREGRDAILFRRDSWGRLVLVGYTLYDGHSIEHYRFLPSDQTVETEGERALISSVR